MNKTKERIFSILIAILLIVLWFGGLAYIQSSGNCQNKAKHNHTYTDQTPWDCTNWRNWK